MLNHIEHATARGGNPVRRRFLASSAGTLNELQHLLEEAAEPVDAPVGAQIAQMLRAIRETASGFGLSDIVRAAARIEEILVLREAYGASGELIVSTKLQAMIDELTLHITRANVPGIHPN